MEIHLYKQVASNMKNTTILIRLLFIILILTSCKSQVNNFEIDEISHIDIFDKYEDNVKLTNDIVNNNWNEFLATKIDGFEKNDIKDLKFFSIAKPKEKKIILQFRYSKSEKSKKMEKIREVTINQIEELKKIQKKNENLILESTKKVEELIRMLNDENYSQFYKNLHSKVTEQFTYEQFIAFTQQIKELGFKKEQREYRSKMLFKFKNYPGELTDIIEYHYWQKDNHLRYESFNFQHIDGKMELVGYKVY